MDFPVSRVNEPSALLAHRLPANHYWLSVELSGLNGTRDAINASVHVVSSGNKKTRLAIGGGSYLPRSDRRWHFGSGNQSMVERLEVRWQGGRVQTLHDVKADRLLRVIEVSIDDR